MKWITAPALCAQSVSTTGGSERADSMMTDPVNTDALRDVAASRLTPEHHVSVINAAANEVDRLRAVIEDAPHADDCTADQVLGRYEGEYVYADCTCWKAGEL